MHRYQLVKDPSNVPLLEKKYFRGAKEDDRIQQERDKQ
jgi:hypothetical protein